MTTTYLCSDTIQSRYTYMYLNRLKSMKLRLTYALTDPYAKHVELQQSMVQLFPARVVHEEVVEEGAAPGSQRAEEVAHR